MERRKSTEERTGMMEIRYEAELTREETYQTTFIFIYLQHIL